MACRRAMGLSRRDARLGTLSPALPSAPWESGLGGPQGTRGRSESESCPWVRAPRLTLARGVVVPRATALDPVPVGICEVASVPAAGAPLKVTGDLWG